MTRIISFLAKLQIALSKNCVTKKTTKKKVKLKHCDKLDESVVILNRQLVCFEDPSICQEQYVPKAVVTS